MIFVNKSWNIQDIEYVHMIEYLKLEYLIRLRGKCILDMGTCLDTLDMNTRMVYMLRNVIYMWLYIYIHVEDGITRISYLCDTRFYVLNAYGYDFCTIVMVRECFL